jgi:hypothetical protein
MVMELAIPSAEWPLAVTTALRRKTVLYQSNGAQLVWPLRRHQLTAAILSDLEGSRC